MDKKNILKAVLIFGGGFLIYALLKNRVMDAVEKKTEKKSADGQPAPAPTMENAEIVYTAYSSALKNGEPPAKLTELNKECMNEFGLRCYVEDGKVVVCDVKGDTVLTK